jgi:hypothetical protein
MIMSPREIAARIIAMREVTKETGFITRRAQNELLTRLSDSQLAEVAFEISRMTAEKEHEPAK